MQPKVLTQGDTAESHSAAPRAKRGLTGVVLGAVLALTLAACSSGGGPGATPTTTGASGTTATTGATITIKNFAFSPPTLTVGPGATVSVTNKDSVTHTLTSETGAFNTGDVAPGSTEHFTAPTTPGTYHYRCNIHQFMTATLRVS
jgi:plastocyanin